MPRLGHDGKPLVLNEFEEKARRQSLNERINRKGNAEGIKNSGSKFDRAFISVKGEDLENAWFDTMDEIRGGLNNLIYSFKKRGVDKQQFLDMLHHAVDLADEDWEEN